MSSLTRAVGAAASRRPLDPVFRWAGGKRWLLPFLDELVEVVQPTSYYEPFVGGGAVFLGFEWPNPTISDINDELISAYRGIARDADAVADVLARFERSRRQYDTLKYEVATDDVYQAARMLYLNRCGYGGVYRTDRNGVFNVPYSGDRGTESLWQGTRLAEVGSALRRATIVASDFEATIALAGEGSFVYCDPVYALPEAGMFRRYSPKSVRMVGPDPAGTRCRAGEGARGGCAR